MLLSVNVDPVPKSELKKYALLFAESNILPELSNLIVERGTLLKVAPIVVWLPVGFSNCIWDPVDRFVLFVKLVFIKPVTVPPEEFNFVFAVK